jgi:hypothetical protein
MGQICYCLNYPFVNTVSYTIDHQSQYNGQGKEKKQIVDSYYKGVPKKHEKIRAGEKIREICKPYPGTPPHSQSGIKAFKSYKETPHREIPEQEKIQYTGQSQQIKPAIGLHFSPDVSFGHRSTLSLGQFSIMFNISI